MQINIIKRFNLDKLEKRNKLLFEYHARNSNILYGTFKDPPVF